MAPKMVHAIIVAVLVALLLSGPTAAVAALQLKLEPPQLVGASNDSATHYWFPSNMAVVLNASHFLVDARLADDCSDYFCNHTSTCKPSDPSHQVSLSTDGGASFAPRWDVGGYSPWSPGLESHPFVGSCTLALNATAQLSLYQGKIYKIDSTPWVSKAAIFTLDPVAGLAWGLAERAVTYGGADAACHTGHLWGQNVIETSTGGAERWLMSAQCDVKVGHGASERKPAFALIFGSNDGYDWSLKSSIPSKAPAGAPACTSPGENTIVELAGNRLLLVARCGDGQPLLGWVSADGGGTWQRHALPPNMHGVMPVAVRMANGAIVLTTGRGGLALWLNANGDGEEWALTNLGAAHNTLVLQNRKLQGASLQYTEAFLQFNTTGESTAYNTLRKLGDNDGVVCYDRKSYTNAALPDYQSTCTPPGNRDKNDHLFCMRFSVVASAEATTA